MARGSPGPQNPSKYPKTGANYKKWGELTQQGYTYNPETDTYVADPAGAKKQLQDEGVIEGPPKEESLTDTLLPIGASAAALAGGKEIGEYLTSGDALSVLKDTATSVGDLFTGGGSSAIGSEALTQVGSAPMADGSAGILMSDGSIVPAGSQFGLMDAGGAIVAGANLLDAAGNLNSRRGKGAVEGAGTVAGTVGGYILGGPLGAGIGSVVGRTAGRGLASLGDSLGFIGGMSTKDRQKSRTGELLDRGFTDEQLKVLRPGTYGVETDDDEWKRLMRIEGNKELFENSVTAHWGSDGMLKAFGPDYLNKMSEQDRWALTRYAIDNKMFKSDAGDRTIPGEYQDQLRASIEEATKNPAYIEEYNRWVALGKPKNGLNPLIVDPTEAQQILETKQEDPTIVPDPNAGLLVPQIDLQNTGVKSPLVIDPSKQGMLA